VVVIGNKDCYIPRPVQLIPDIRDIRDVRGEGVYFYHVPPGTVDREPSFHYVKTAVEWALEGKIAAVVTAPVSKEKWLKAGVPYKGHTEYLAESAGVSNHCMFFWSADLKTALFTVHIPLKEVFGHLRKDRVIEFIRFVEGELRRLFGRRFHMLVNGLNPHAGESGFLGTEEEEIIIPAVEALKQDMSIEGPFPPDVIFIKARETEDSVVISWYHDQGLIAFKLLNIHSGVNMTLGLPYIRTSPDHGTAYDIAGKGIANASSMKEAILLARQLVAHR
jgi:4-hydroxythreonine-4-phosphate dehydrogenase